MTAEARVTSVPAAPADSNLIFGGTALIWLFNFLIAVIRGTGNLILPVAVVCGGALFLTPLPPFLIFGLGPIPGLRVIGGAVGLLTYYAILHPSARPPRLRFRPFYEILQVGGMSSLVSASTNITLAITTGFFGVSALAGYGAGARLEFMLVSLSYAIGEPAGILIGTRVGAHHNTRVLRVVWIERWSPVTGDLRNPQSSESHLAGWLRQRWSASTSHDQEPQPGIWRRI